MTIYNLDDDERRCYRKTGVCYHFPDMANGRKFKKKIRTLTLCNNRTLLEEEYFMSSVTGLKLKKKPF